MVHEMRWTLQDAAVRQAGAFRAASCVHAQLVSLCDSLLWQRVSMQVYKRNQQHLGLRLQACPVQDGELVLQALRGMSAAQHAGMCKAAACLERRPACSAACVYLADAG